jgi:hypothetical protein
LPNCELSLLKQLGGTQPVTAIMPEMNQSRKFAMLTIATFNLCNLSATAPPARLARLGEIVVEALGTPDILAVQEIAADSPAMTGPVPADATYQSLIVAISHAGGPAYEFREIPPLARQDGGMAGANIRGGGWGGACCSIRPG